MENVHSKNVLTKFRVGVHHLEVEKGRLLKIKYSDRKCKLCNEEVEEEIHIGMLCNILFPIIDKISFNINSTVWIMYWS
jgi:hypothetical protein